jgi:hypothetical protein
MEVRTACEEKSIWLELPEDTFREHLVTLQDRTNTIPMDPKVFKPTEWVSEWDIGSSHRLPLEVEQQVADDFACLAAVAEGAQSVAAVCIEEHTKLPGVTIRFAAVDISLDEDVKTALGTVADILMHAASASESGNTTSDTYVKRLFDVLIELHRSRILARLRSSKWEKPKYLSKSHKKPLWQDFPNLIHRAQFAYTKQEKTTRQTVESQLNALSLIYEGFETTKDDFSLKHLVGASLEFCSREEIKDFLRRLQSQTNQTAQVAGAIKSLRQIQKIAAHRRMSISLIQIAQKYTSLFQIITIAYLAPYKSVPTTIGYHAWARTCHVHAEVQLAVYYDLNPEYRPRVIGTSKWLCYLCYWFLKAHKLFFPAKTHGQLYDQWTIPDLMEFDKAMVTRYRRVVRDMDEAIIRQIEGEPEMLRLKPMTSCTVD